MSQDIQQDSLFEDPIGLRFRAARERLRWSIEAAAQQLKLPKDVLEAIEREDWARLGPAIYARSYITSYARLLGLPVALADEAVAGRQQPELVSSIGSVSKPRRLAGRTRGLGRPAGIALAVVALLAIAWAFGLPDAVRRAVGGGAGGRDTVAAPGPGAGAGAVAAVPAASSRAPVTEVLAMPSPGAPATAAAGEGDVVLRFRGDSWVEVLGADGATIERGLVAAGTERRFAPGQIRQLTLGDAAAVDVSQGGAMVAPGPGGAAKVARFTVSSDGSIHPSAID